MTKNNEVIADNRFRTVASPARRLGTLGRLEQFSLYCERYTCASHSSR